MQRLTGRFLHEAFPLHGIEASRAIERASLSRSEPGELMARAGLSVARLAMAIAPHARHIWVACGPGNNGGDGWVAATELKKRGYSVTTTWLGTLGKASSDTLMAHERAQAAGLIVAPSPPAEFDLAIDALLGLGAGRAPTGEMADWIARMNASPAPAVSIDLPTGLHAETGMPLAEDSPFVRAGATLTLLTAKPGLFTAFGRDAAGEIWFDDLGCSEVRPVQPTARLLAAPAPLSRPHASHKGSWGDVAVVGGAASMQGAAVLAARAALHAGAGRVYLALLSDAPGFDPAQPELMLRRAASIAPERCTVVCGCGGGDAVRTELPRLLSAASRLVLDADALNAIAGDSALAQLLKRRGPGKPTVMTPHPLEAARLLAVNTNEVQTDRLAAAQALASRFGCVVVLKGSGSIVAAPGEVPAISPVGNARLATGGTGDVLAGLIGALLAREGHGDPRSAWRSATAGVYLHGRIADEWPANEALTASRLAARLTP